MKLCKKCNLTFSNKFEFCPKCGSNLVEDASLKCPNCARLVEKDYVFCPYCGYDLQKNSAFKKPVTLNAEDELKLGIEFNEKEKYQEADKHFANAVALGNYEAIVWRFASPNYNLVNIQGSDEISKDIYAAIENSNTFRYEKTFENMYHIALDLDFLGAIDFEENPINNIYYKLAFKLNEVAAQHGIAKSLYALGLAYENGEGIEENYNKAFEYCEKAAEQRLAEAVYHLGNMYKLGKGVLKDLNKSKELYQQAAEEGVSDAQVALALMYFSGELVVRDYAKAFELFKKAADQNHPEAQYYLAFMYENEFYVKRDIEKSRQLYKKASSNGFKRANEGLKRLEMRKNSTIGVEEKKKNQNTKTKFEECYELANKGDVNAINSLAEMYYDGNGVDKNYEKAIEWYSKAAEQGFAPAQHSMGWMYEKGYGVDKNYEKAVEWYSKAAEQEYALSLNNLGCMYKDGKGVNKNTRKAFEFFTRAANQGNSNACNNLGLMYNHGHGIEKNNEKAVEWFTKAANQGLAAAQYNLGCLLQSGYDIGNNFSIVPNYDSAREWYKKAADNGYEPAKKALEKIKNSRISISFGAMVATENEMNAFMKICQVAEHGASYNENWKALGYSYPKTGILGSFFKSANDKKSELLLKKLIDTIVSAGLNVIRVKADSISCGFDFYGKKFKNVLKTVELQEGLQRGFRLSKMSVESLFRYNKLTTNDASRLDNVFKMIDFSYTEIFNEIFKEYKR